MRLRVATTVVCLVAILALVACGSGGKSGQTASGTSTDSTAGSASTGTTATTASTSPTISSLNITAGASSIGTNQTLQFTANGLFSDGTTQDVTQLATWTSSDPSVVFPTPGLAYGSGATNGAATITATLNGVSTTIPLTVTSATLASIDVAPDTAVIPAGANQQFTANGTWSDGSTQDVTTNPAVTWSSDNATVSSVGAHTGLAVALAAGTANITASAPGATSDFGQITVPSGATLASISVTPTNPTVALSAKQQQFAATGTFTDGSSYDITASASWASSVATVATIDANGLASLAGTGNSVITASFGGITSAADALTVRGAHLTQLSVTPVAPSIGVGGTVQFNVTGQFDDGSTADLTSLATWSSSKGAIATVSATGLASTGAVGQSTITASFGGMNNAATLTVIPNTLSQIIVLPDGVATSTVSMDASGQPIQPSVTMVRHSHLKLVAWGYYTDQNFHQLSNARFSSSKPSIAVISGSVARSKGRNGTITVRTTWMDPASGTRYSANPSLTVSNASVTAITVTPSSASFAQGTGMQFKATAQISDGTTQDVTSLVRWTTSNRNIVVARGGWAYGIAPGSATVSATYYNGSAGTTGSASVTITNAKLTGLSIGPSPANLTRGSSLQLSATGTFSDGSQQDLTNQVFWHSQNLSVVVMSRFTPGFAIGSGAGSALVSAQVNGVSATTSIVVGP